MRSKAEQYEIKLSDAQMLDVFTGYELATCSRQFEVVDSNFAKLQKQTSKQEAQLHKAMSRDLINILRV